MTACTSKATIWPPFQWDPAGFLGEGQVEAPAKSAAPADGEAMEKQEQLNTH